MRKWLIILGVLIALAAIAAWRLPASLVLGPAQARLPALDWSQASGTAWHGEVAGFVWKGMQLGTLSWSFDGIEDLGSGHTRWNIHTHSPQHDVRALVTLNPDGDILVARDVHGHVPAMWVDITDRLPLVYLDGSIELDIDHVELDRNMPVTGAGRVTWSQAAITGGANEQFGTLQLNLAPRGAGQAEGMAFELSSLEPADVRFQGNGNILRNDYDIDLQLQVAPQREDLVQFLGQVGGRTAPGRYRYAWQGRIR